MTEQNGISATIAEQEPEPIASVLGSGTIPALSLETSEEIERRRRERADCEWSQHIERCERSLVTCIGPRYARCRASNWEYSPDPEVAEKQRAVLNKLEAYAKNMQANIEAGRGVVFYGPTGTGKDHLLAALMFHAAKKGISVTWRNGVKLYANLRDSFDSERTEGSFAKELIDPQVLAISDPLPPFGALTQFQSTFLFSVLDERYRLMRPTWITSNFRDGQEAADRMGVQIIERLKDQSLALHCNWPSYRTPLKQEQPNA